MVVLEALVVKLAAIEESQVKVLPLAIVATNTSPKLLNDQSPGSKVTVAASRNPQRRQSRNLFQHKKTRQN